MPAMNLRELRNARKLKAWLRSGQTVEFCERNRVFGRIVPIPSTAELREWPDFAGRLKKIFGERTLPGADFGDPGTRGRY